MKRRYISRIIPVFAALLTLACVDEYQDANPPARLDAPYAYVSYSIEPGSAGIPLAGGEEVTITANIVDAPGVLNEVAFAFSQGGEVVSHTFDQLVGKTGGTFDVTVKAPYNINGQTTFSMDIKDRQDNPKVLSITTPLDVSYLHEGADFTVEIDDDDGLLEEGDVVNVIVTVNEVPSGEIAVFNYNATSGTLEFDQSEVDALIGQSSGSITGQLTVGPVASTGVQRVTVSITDLLQNRQVVESDEILYVCPASADISGTYVATTNGVNGEGDPGEENFYALEKEVTITQVNAGQFEVSDLTFGLYIMQNPTYGELEGIINVCGTEVVGDATVGDGWTASGTIQTQTTGVIVIEWSNQYGDSGTTILKKK